MRIGQVALIVKDYEEAIDFYCKKLGFSVLEDTCLPTKRWIRIGHVKNPGGTEILVSKAENIEQAAVIGKQAGGRVFLFLYTDDIETEFNQLKAVGVKFTENLRSESYGKVAVFEDLYGNRIDLIEPNDSP